MVKSCAGLSALNGVLKPTHPFTSSADMGAKEKPGRRSEVLPRDQDFAVSSVIYAIHGSDNIAKRANSVNCKQATSAE